MMRLPSGKVKKVNGRDGKTKKINLGFSFMKGAEVKVTEVNERIGKIKKIL
jgi:SH3-like domain-containing protein